MANEGFEGWAILELMGHRRLAGFLSEQEIGGTNMLRIDVPNSCTGITASHCPVHGDCKCPEPPQGAPKDLDDANCPLHAPDGDHGEGNIATQFYSSSAVYCITPTSEDIARAVARRSQPAPVSRYELSPPTPTSAERDDDEIDAEIDDAFDPKTGAITYDQGEAF